MLTISVINYHGRHDTEQCIRELFNLCRGLDYRILVRDNSEISETALLEQSLRDTPCHLHFFDSPDNPGFARGHNLNFQAVEHGEGDVFLILNPDVRFPVPDLIVRMLEYCTVTRIVSCVIETGAPAGVWFSGGFIGSMTGMPATSRERFSGPFRRVDFVTGCCLMISSVLFGRLGGFDESYFMYSEDVDLCLRATCISTEILVVNQRMMHHVGSGEKGEYSDLYLYEGTRNRLLCLRRHKLGILPIGISYTVLKYGIFRTVQLAVFSKSPLRQIRAAWRGLVEGLCLEPRSIQNVVRQ